MQQTWRTQQESRPLQSQIQEAVLCKSNTGINVAIYSAMDALHNHQTKLEKDVLGNIMSWILTAAQRALVCCHWQPVLNTVLILAPAEKRWSTGILTTLWLKGMKWSCIVLPRVHAREPHFTSGCLLCLFWHSCQPISLHTELKGPKAVSSQLQLEEDVSGLCCSVQYWCWRLDGDDPWVFCYVASRSGLFTLASAGLNWKQLKAASKKHHSWQMSNLLSQVMQSQQVPLTTLLVQLRVLLARDPRHHSSVVLTVSDSFLKTNNGKKIGERNLGWDAPAN